MYMYIPSKKIEGEGVEGRQGTCSIYSTCMSLPLLIIITTLIFMKFYGVYTVCIEHVPYGCLVYPPPPHHFVVCTPLYESPADQLVYPFSSTLLRACIHRSFEGRNSSCCPECGLPAWVRDVKANRQLDNLIRLMGTMRELVEGRFSVQTSSHLGEGTMYMRGFEKLESLLMQTADSCFGLFGPRQCSCSTWSLPATPS